MRPIHKILGPTLLVTYAGISLLGQGLHFLTPDDHHHHAVGVAECNLHEHDHGACGPSHEQSQHGYGSSTDLVAADHNCDICEFLAQAKSQTPQIASPPDLHAVVAELPIHADEFSSPIILGLHAPRGPPQLLT